MKVHTTGELTAIPQGDYALISGCIFLKRGNDLQRLSFSGGLGALIRSHGSPHGTIESRATLAKLIEKRLLQENSNGKALQAG